MNQPECHNIFPCIFLGFFVYLCCPSEANKGFSAILGSNPPKDWHSLLCAGEEPDLNPGLLICNQVRCHWATILPMIRGYWEGGRGVRLLSALVLSHPRIVGGMQSAGGMVGWTLLCRRGGVHTRKVASKLKIIKIVSKLSHHQLLNIVIVSKLKINVLDHFRTGSKHWRLFNFAIKK